MNLPCDAFNCVINGQNMNTLAILHIWACLDAESNTQQEQIRADPMKDNYNVKKNHNIHHINTIFIP